MCLMLLGISSCSSDEILIERTLPPETTPIQTVITRGPDDDEQKVGNARMIIFVVDNGTERLWSNQHKNFNNAAITFDTIVPVGYMHLFLIANEQPGWDLGSVTSRTQLKRTMLQFNAYPVVNEHSPIPMFGQYENVYIDSKGQTTINGAPVDLTRSGGTVSRLFSKVTIDLVCKFSELANGGNDPIQLKKISIKQMPKESYLSPVAYSKTTDTDFFDGAPGSLLSPNYVEVADSFKGNFLFYIPEYLPYGLDKRTNISIEVALRDEPDIKREYHVIIGDGVRTKTNTEMSAATGVTVADLAVTRNTHYHYTIRVKSFDQNSAKNLEIDAKVVTWEPVDIPGPSADYDLDVTPTEFKVGTGAYSGVVLITTTYAHPLTATSTETWINNITITNNGRLSFDVTGTGTAGDTGYIEIAAGKLTRKIKIVR
jgi:hypothetical protein